LGVIKFRLEKWERAVVFQIFEQDKFEHGVVYNNGEFIIEVLLHPEQSCNYIYLRGENSSEDFRVSSVQFNTNSERDAYYDEILKVFSDWKKSLETKSIETKEQNIFEF
jgi:hypothetical protein